MKITFLLLFALIFSLSAFTQNKTTPLHGAVYGDKPDTTGVMSANKVEEFMDNKTRVSVAVRGRVLKVTQQKGGWFIIDEGKGRIINAHFKNYNVTIPASLAGKTVVMDCVAQKQFIADDQQHFAGDTVNGKKQSQVKTNPKRRLTFEVKGLMVD
ncbi:MAG TPA: DUF4920 domain-containing protein [Mucilaginibacter sp.]|jgi:hypothetical protein|nr:DUF4920 domain-containing protein [Mucilaginibacter sp.]